MKKIYLNLLFAFLVTCAGNLKAQCSLPAPVVSGNTLICNSNGIFTLTAASALSLTTAWYALPTGGNAIATGASYITPNLATGTTTYYVGQNTSASTTSITQPPHVTTILAMSRGYWFTAPVSFIITGIRVPTDASAGVASVAILKLTGTPPTYPTVDNTFTTLYLKQLATSSGTNIIPVYVPVYAGDYIGILGDRNDTTSYSPNPYNGSLGSNAITLTRLGMLFNLSTNVPQDIWTESINNIGRVEVYTTLGCLSTLTPVQVVVSPAVQISIAGPTAPICAGQTTTLSASGANSYTWTGGIPGASISPTPNTTGIYSVTGADQYGCANTQAITVTVSPLPIISIAASNSIICTGHTGTLTLSGASTYTWSTGFNSINLPITPTTTTTYSASGTDSLGCTGSAAITVSIGALPTLTVTSSQNTICAGQSATLSANGASSYSWSNGPTTQNNVVSPTVQKSYTVTGTNAVGCSKSSVITVFVSQCTAIEKNNPDDQSVLVYPNPANSLVSIQSTHIIRQVILKDLSGRVIIDQRFDTLTDLHLNIENLKAGIYFVEVVQEETSKTIKIIKN